VATFLREDAQSQQPFYAQIGFVETHTPFEREGTEPDTEKGVEIPAYLADTASSKQAMAAYQGAVRTVDTAVGSILKALRESGLEDHTLVVFTTDHGIEMPRAKWHLYDPGIAAGLVMRAPSMGLTGGRTCNLLMSNVDYLPTLLDFAQVEYPGEIQGRSFAGQLNTDRPSQIRDAVFGLYHKTQTRYVRTDRFKLIRHFSSATDFSKVPVRIEDAAQKRVIKQVELFDLEADPNEFNNLVLKSEYNDIKNQLDDMLWKWMESVDDPLLKGPVSTPSYEAEIQDYVKWKNGNG
jgi:arylsulfatase A-like enzyme